MNVKTPAWTHLAKARRAAGLSQAELAEGLSISIPSVSRHETGKRGVSVDLFVRWMAACGQTVCLSSGDGGPEAVRDPDRMVLQQFLAAWDRMPLRVRRMFAEQFEIWVEMTDAQGGG